MRSIIISTDDTASTNIRDRLLEMAEWREEGSFSGLPAYRWKDCIMVQHPGPHIHAEGIDRQVEEFLGERPELLIFASKHKSASGRKALTVHPVGNYGAAELGGRPGELSETAPLAMTAALRGIHERNTMDDFSVSYEVTHHGPYLEIPSFFIEIGSTEIEWGNREAGRILAEVILGMEHSEGDEVAIGIGGGHYAPRFTELALRRRISFGHMAAKYALEYLNEGLLKQMVEKSGAKYVYFHKSGLKRSDISRLGKIFEESGVTRIREADISQTRIGEG